MAVGPGTILDARYRVDEELGIGGMGTVWRGHDPRFNRKVAIKVLRSDDPDPQLISRFRREAEILGNLSDQGITVAYDCGQHNGHFFIVMELLEGSDLAKVLESHSARTACGPGFDARGPGGEGAGRGARQGGGAPRHQAVQPVHREGRPAQDLRLRHREVGRQRLDAHPARARHGDPRVHVAGAER